MTALQTEEEHWAPSSPAPPELIERAAALVRAYPECFWFWHPDAKVDDIGGVRLVVENLRKYGGHRAWREAQALYRCL